MDESSEETGVGVAAAQSTGDSGEGLGPNKGGFVRDGGNQGVEAAVFRVGPKS